jgi:hypothetical protein
VLEDVRQRQQQEIFNKLSLQEIFLHLAVFLSPYALECHIIYFCILQAKIEVYHNVWHLHMFSETYTCWKFYI